MYDFFLALLLVSYPGSCLVCVGIAALIGVAGWTFALRSRTVALIFCNRRWPSRRRFKHTPSHGRRMGAFTSAFRLQSTTINCSYSFCYLLKMTLVNASFSLNLLASTSCCSLAPAPPWPPWVAPLINFSTATEPSLVPPLCISNLPLWVLCRFATALHTPAFDLGGKRARAFVERR